MKYEIEPVCFPDHKTESLISTLTGHDLPEIKKWTGDKKTFRGQELVKTFLRLGFFTNRRFIPFDKDTQYPCLMRCRFNIKDRYWYIFAYYDGKIYDGLGDVFEFKDCVRTLNGKSYFIYQNCTLKITSMLQVWI